MRIEIVLNELLSLSVFFSCFCRAIKTGPDTRFSVLAAFYTLSLASLVNITAPIFSAWRPDFIHVITVGAIALVQIVTSHHWKHGVPASLQRP